MHLHTVQNLVVFIGVSAAGSGALAAQVTSDSVVTLPRVVVTATRTPVARHLVPSAVTVLEGAELRARGVRFVSDALRDVPGLAVVQTCSFGSLTSLFVRGGESDYVKVLVDGVPLNEPGGALDVAHLTTDNVERIEIVRGPASVLYGSDAVTAVVQVFTRGGEGAARGELSVRGGTYGTLEAATALRGGGEPFRYAFSVARHVTDGIYPFNNRYRNTVGSGLAEVRPDDRTVARLAFRYGDGVYHFPTDGTGALVDSNQLRVQEQTTVSLDAGRQVTPHVELRALATVSRLDAMNDDQPDGQADTLGFFLFRDQQAVTRRSGDLRANVSVAPGAVLTVGGALEEQQGRRVSVSGSQFGRSSSAASHQRETYALYAQVHASPATGLGVHAGLRLDQNSAFGRFGTARAGLTYRWATGTRLRAAWGTAFKEPTFFENFSESPFARGNPELRPERAASWEAGLEQTLLGGRFTVAAGYFAQRFRDLIQYTFTPPNPGDPNFYNVAAAEAWGTEIEVTLVPVPGLDLQAAHTYLRTNVTDAGLDTDGLQFVQGEPLLRRPAKQWSLRATYAIGRWGTLGGIVRHVGERHDRNFATFPAEAVIVPAYTTADVSLQLTPVRWEPAGSLGLQTTVHNLFNAKYQQVFGFPAPGRVILIGGHLSL